jgi:hypothetical protein
MTRRIRARYWSLGGALAKQTFYRAEVISKQGLRLCQATFQRKIGARKGGTLREAPERGVCSLRHVPVWARVLTEKRRICVLRFLGFDSGRYFHV